RKARQPIEPIVDRRRFGQEPPERVRRDAEAGRHADAFDARKLPQVCALATDDRELRPVDVLETQHVTHPLSSLSRSGIRAFLIDEGSHGGADYASRPENTVL